MSEQTWFSHRHTTYRGCYNAVVAAIESVPDAFGDKAQTYRDSDYQDRNGGGYKNANLSVILDRYHSHHREMKFSLVKLV
jgi:hypothetical protein